MNGQFGDAIGALHAIQWEWVGKYQPYPVRPFQLTWGVNTAKMDKYTK